MNNFERDREREREEREVRETETEIEYSQLNITKFHPILLTANSMDSPLLIHIAQLGSGQPLTHVFLFIL